MAKLTVELFSDTICPWCLIGSHRLDRVLTQQFPGIDAEIIRRPFLLMPDLPEEGVLLADLFKARFNVADPSVIHARTNAEAASSGLEVDFNRQQYVYPTIRSHTLIRHAQPKSTAHALGTALALANFRDARNINDSQVLAGIAVPFGFAHDEALALLANPAELDITRRDAAASAARGIRSVPYFVFNGVPVEGAHREPVLAAAIERALAA